MSYLFLSHSYLDFLNIGYIYSKLEIEWGLIKNFTVSQI